MKFKSILAFGAALSLSIFTSKAAVLTVDDDGVQCPGAPFNTIQAAVTAAHSGDTIRVCPGTYPEQVRIDKRLTLKGQAVGNESLILVRPTMVTPNSNSLEGSAAPIAAVILVDGADNVTLENLTVDGAGNTLTSCGQGFYGIYYRNASGKVDSVAVRNIRLASAPADCESGSGILAQSADNESLEKGSGGHGTSRLQVIGSTIHDYRKNGITANGAGTELTARGNTVTGSGSDNFVAQNGIQIAFGAKGQIDGNAIIDHIFGPCVSLQQCGMTATNVLIIGAGEAKVRLNSLGKSQTSVAVLSNNADVTANWIYDTDVFDGIAVFGNQNDVERNVINDSDEAAIVVAGNDNEVKNNRINETPVGIFLGANNQRTRLRGNDFYNTAMNVATEATPGAKLHDVRNTPYPVSPLRP